MRLSVFLLVLAVIVAAAAAYNMTSATKVTLNVSYPEGVTGFFLKTSDDMNSLAQQVFSEAVKFFRSTVAFIVVNIL
ncbi:MAG: hypothetical protein ACE5J7_01395 [Candidatus Aenigmatarchaeota archaeon]